MALLKFKRSATPSKVPTTSDLALGELALNTYDGKVYMKKDDGTQAIVEVGGTSGGGTVTSVDVSGGTTGLTFSGGPVTSSGTITQGGTLNVANGGTGATTAAGALANLGAQAAATALTTSTTFGGDVSGTYNAIVVADDSHNHIIGNVDGLQTALDGKLNLSGGTITGNLYVNGFTSPETILPVNLTDFDSATSTSARAQVFRGPFQATNRPPSANYHSGIHFRHALSGDYASQFAMGSSTSNQAWIRNQVSGTWQDWSELFHDGYHPNADTLTTARTISLTGDVSGSTSFDGSANVSITATVADDSHNHVISNVDGLQTALDGKLSTTGKAADSNLFDNLDSVRFVYGSNQYATSDGRTDINNLSKTGHYWSSSATNKPSTGNGTTFHINHDGGTSYATQMFINHDGNEGAYFRAKDAGTWNSWQRIFSDDYHPNADTLTTARTISLTGDVSGSTSFNGSANVSITAVVADDSHNHIISNVDGLQAALDAKEAADDTILVREGDISSQDWNTYIDGTEASWNTVLNHSGSNRPASSYGYGTALNFSKSGQAKFQMYVPETAGSASSLANGIWYRAGWNTTFRDWTRVLDSNYAPFSGLTSKTSGTGTYQTSGDFRAPIFYDSNDTAYYINPNGNSKFAGNITGDAITGIGKQATSGLAFMPTVGGGSFRANSNATGAIQITMPTHGGADMISFWVDIYDYTNDETFSVYVAGYVYQAIGNNVWLAETALIIGAASHRNFNVRFGHDGSDACVWIGETDSVWQYPQVTVRDVQAGHSANVADWIDGWSISLATSFTAVERTISNAFPASRFDTLINTSSGTGTYQTSGDFRAPRFYDSNNTAFYLDPAATSILNGADFDGIVRIATGSVGPANTTDGLVFDGNYTNGQYRHRFRKRDDSGGIPLYLDYAANTANSYTELMKFGPNTADGSYLTVYGIISSNTDIRAPRLYDSNNTGYYLDPASTSLSLAAAGPVRVGPASALPLNYASNYSANGGSIQLTLERTGTSVGWGGIGADNNNCFAAWNTTPAVQFRVTTGGAAFATESFRAPIFYDSNNTAYYADPASTSNLNALTLAGVLTPEDPDNFKQTSLSSLTSASINYPEANVGATSQYCPLLHGRFLQDAGYRTHLDVGVYKSTNNTWNEDYFYIASGGNDNYPTKEWKFITQATTLAHSDGYVTIDGSARAPIFYDSDNTAYYVNPASTTQLNALNTVGTISGNGKEIFATTDSYLRINQSATFSSGIWFGSSNLGQSSGGYASFGSNGGTTTSRVYIYGGTYNGTNVISIDGSNGRVTALDSRADIFYDRNDTNYYVDPNSTSVTHRMGSNYFQNNAAVSTDNPFGLYFDSGLSSAYAIFRESGGWTSPFPDLRIAFHTGIKIGANAAYGGVKFYTDYDMATQVMSVNNSSDGLGSSNVYVNNSLQAGSSLRAPIFYESTNTAYYVDPLTGSYVGGEFGVKQSGTNGFRIYSPTGTQSLWVRAGYDTDGTATPVSSPTNIQFQSSGSSGGSFTFVSGNTKALTVSGDYAQGAGSLRAPIFYDSDDTGYYINPNATSNCSTVQAINFQATATHGNGYRFWASDSYKIYMSSSGNGTWGGRVAGETTSDYNMYFRMTGGTNRGFVFSAGSAGTTKVAGIDASGNGRFIGDVVAYSSSDARLKENLEVIPNALDKVQALSGYTFDWNDKQDAYEVGKRDVGVIAQDVEAVLPEVVVDRELTGYKAVNYEKLVPLLIEAIKELKAEVETLKKG